MKLKVTNEAKSNSVAEARQSTVPPPHWEKHMNSHGASENLTPVESNPAPKAQ